MRKVVVFDFDKTLTYDDSLTLLFLKKIKEFFFIYKYFYWGLKVLSKLKIISVKTEKLLTIRLLYHSNKEEFKRDCVQIGNTIQLTPLYQLLSKYCKEGYHVIVVSASPEYILKTVFAKIPVDIIGLTFEEKGNRLISIEQHPYGRDKRILLEAKGFTHIDVMYYDSKSDEYLIPLCKSFFRVKNGQILKCSI